MYEYFPLLVTGAVIGVLLTVFSVAFFLVKDTTEEGMADRHMKDGALLARLLPYARPFVKSFIVVFLLMALAISYQIVSPLIVSHIEETVKTAGFELSHLWLSVAVYAGVVVVAMIAMYFQAVLLQKTGQKIITAIRLDLFSKIESLSHAQLSTMPVGKLVTRVTNDVDGVSTAFTGLLVDCTKNLFVLLGVTAAMFVLNTRLALMVLCFLPFIALFTLLFRHFSRRAHRMQKNATTDLNTMLSEHLSGMKIVQIFNREDETRDLFEQKNKKLTAARWQHVMVFSVFRPVISVLYWSAVLLLLFFAGRGYLSGGTLFGQIVTGGTVVAFYLYIDKFFDPVQTLAEQFNRLQSAFASAEKIFSLLDEQPTVTDEPDAVDLDEVRGEIEFRDVWFSYLPDEWVLKGVSFKVEAGQTAAFVGATGSGKTTILSLLCRNYDIQRGEILLDGVNIRHVRIASLRRHFGQMLQDVFLFAGTVRDNITLGDEFTDKEVEESCALVNADRFIGKLKNGVDEEVRERGNNFSAGQRQLISFARTVIHKPEILILDEATANIDTETEVIIQDSLEKMMQIGTMLVVAHRLSTIRRADKIFVLSRGEIIEQGTHNELLAQRGRYYQLYTLQ